jgi:hypothetical protein
VVDRVKSHYSDERAYRRIEKGDRVPDREALIAVLATGLSMDQTDQINAILALGGYEALTFGEIQALGLNSHVPTVPATAVPPPTLIAGSWFGVNRGLRPVVAAAMGSLGVAAAIAWTSGEPGYVLVTAVLYAILYAESVLLESVFDPSPASKWQVAATVFGFVLVTSVLALSLDARFAESGSIAALPLSLAIFLIAAAVQWAIARSALSETAVVPMHFEGHTPQTAHLKNTSYFLLIVVLFWLLPFHCVSALRREYQGGHASRVKGILTHRLLVGRDFASFNAEPLWYFCLFLLLLTIPMAVRLLEGLKSGDSRRNTYTALLYLRGVLYFFLIVVCLIWYSSAVATLTF